MYIFLSFIIVGFLVLTSTFVMAIWFKTNRVLNFYLILTSLVLCYYLIVHGFNNYKLIVLHDEIWCFNYYQIVILLTPSVYLFFEKLITNSKYPEKKDILYFIIPLSVSYYLGYQDFQDILIEKVLVFILCTFFTLFFVGNHTVF